MRCMKYEHAKIYLAAKRGKHQILGIYVFNNNEFWNNASVTRSIPARIVWGTRRALAKFLMLLEFLDVVNSSRSLSQKYMKCTEN